MFRTPKNSESRFTSPSEECPYPHYWTSEDSDSTENEVLELLHGLVRGLQPDFCIETGTAFGFGAKAIGEALRDNGHGRLVSLETDATRVKQARERTQGLPVTIKQQSSLSYSPQETIDFAFFDSLFNLRIQEFHFYRHQMTDRTIVAFHDSGFQHPLRPQINQLARDGYIDLIHLPTPRGLTLGRVKPL